MLPNDLVVKSMALKSVNVETRTASFVASTDTKDADGDIVEQSWKLERFKQNPVVLFAHDNRSLPIGKAPNTEVRDGKLETEIEFASAAANPLAENVWQSVKEKTLRAVSVGFRPKTIRKERHDDKDVYILADNELYEISVVPIPSNPDAVARMKAAVPYAAHEPVESESWDAAAAVKRMKAACMTDGEMDWAKFKKGFAWYDEEHPDMMSSYKMPHHDMKDGAMVTAKGGVMAAGNAMMGARGGVNIPASEMGAVKAHLAKHYKQFGLTPPWEQEETADGGEENKQMELEEKCASLEKTVAALNERCKALETELSEAREKNLAHELASVEKDIDALVGVKIAPTEKASLLKIAALDRALFNEHVKAIGERQNMTILGKVMPADPTPHSLPSAGADDGRGFEKLIGRVA